MNLQNLHDDNIKGFLEVAKSVLSPEQLSGLRYVLEDDTSVPELLIYELLRQWNNPALTRMYLQMDTVLGSAFAPSAPSAPSAPTAPKQPRPVDPDDEFCDLSELDY